MENLDHDHMEEDEFPNEFQCCVCLDIMYKPVVLACGHISCFWCVFQAMDTTQESNCPVCRQSYNHFPRICELMHFMLLKLYPSAYKRREKQVAEEEKGYGHTSPQFKEDKLIDPEFSEVPNAQCSSPPLLEAVLSKPNSACGGDQSSVRDFYQTKFHNVDNSRNNPTSSSSQEAICVVEYRKQNLLTHLQCDVCEQLLCRPAVLNCGHVYCEACISPHNNACMCPKCQCLHPNGFPNVCLVLEHFLEEHFPNEYKARKESLSNSQNTTSPSTGSRGNQEAAPCSTVPKYMLPSMFPGRGHKLHRGVGCDYCGMCPIVGERYKCRDCVESIGFDLCENCYNSSSKLPGRFNQQHTQDHRLEIVQPVLFQDIILSLGAGHFVDVDEVFGVVNSNNGGVVLTGAFLSNDSLEDELETISSVNAQDNDSRGDFDDAVASPNSSHYGSQDEHSNSSA